MFSVSVVRFPVRWPVFRLAFSDSAGGRGKRFHLFTKYAGSIGKLVNYWRENLGDFINHWETINGTQQPAQGVSYRRCPLRLVSNRWGSVRSTEMFILQRQRKLLQPVLLALFSKRMKSATKPSGESERGSRAGPKAKHGAKSGKTDKTRKTDKTDALLDDSSRETYNIKLSKWASGACAAVLSSLWWLLLEVSQKTRAPLTHFFLWIQSSDEDKKQKGCHIGDCDPQGSFHNDRIPGCSGIN